MVTIGIVGALLMVLWMSRGEVAEILGRGGFMIRVVVVVAFTVLMLAATIAMAKLGSP